MSFSLIYIRYLQLIRALKDGGLGTVLLPIAIAGLSMASYKAYQNQVYGLVLVGVIVASCVVIHIGRKDKFFTRVHLQNRHVQHFSEYALLTSPFTLTALFTSHFYYFPALLLLLWLVPFITYSPSQKTTFTTLSRIFAPAHSIEWISGFRTSFLTIIPCYALALGMCWFRFLPLLLLWFTTISILSFYNEYEPLPILKANHISAKDFLHEKIKKHSLYICISYAPILIMNSFFHPDFLEINILFLAIQIALIVFGISFKYSSYLPIQQNSASSITVALMAMASIIPFMLPLPVLFAWIYYKKAVQNLHTFFYD